MTEHMVAKVFLSDVSIFHDLFNSLFGCCNTDIITPSFG